MSDFLKELLDELSDGDPEGGREILRTTLSSIGHDPEKSGKILENLDLSHLQDKEGTESFAIPISGMEEDGSESWVFICVEILTDQPTLRYEELKRSCVASLEKEEDKVVATIPKELMVTEIDLVGKSNTLQLETEFVDGAYLIEQAHRGVWTTWSSL